MTLKFLDHLFREQLLRRREVVMLTLRYIAAEEKLVDMNREWKDVFAEESRKRLIRVLRRSYEDELKKIDNALTRVGTRDYGRCRLCSKAIDRRVLKLSPATELCPVCQKAQRHRREPIRGPERKLSA
jgi:RNA polymerase-binding transcription factor DksA